MQLNAAELANVERELCSRSLAEFAKRAWAVLEPGTELKWGWALDAICLHLEAVTDGRITRLLMNVPPGSMKSLLTGVLWPAWEWGPKGMPEKRFIGTAHEETLAIRDSRKCRDLIKSEWYQSLWPLQLASDLDGKREFGNTSKGTRQARAFTSMTGVRGDRVILDDPISADNANSAAKLEAARLAFTETLPTRVNSEKSAIVVIMQRLNEKDVSGVILNMGLPYVHLRIPMRFEAKNRCTTEIGWTDPRTYEGELMFPERFGEKQVSELEKTLGSYGAAGQLQQRSAPRSGGIFQPDQMPVIDALPALPITWVRGWDLAASQDKGDYTAGGKLGKLSDGRYVIADMVRVRLGSDKRDAAIKNTADRDGKGIKISLPQDPGQAGKTQILAMTKMLAGWPIHTSTETGDKVTRADPFASQVNVGNVMLLRGSWNDLLIEEMRMFPNGANDDQVDALSRAFSVLIDTNEITPHGAKVNGL